MVIAVTAPVPPATAMNFLATCFSIVVFLVALSVLYDGMQYRRRIRKLARSAPLNTPDAPLLSIIIPARNEEKHIERALASVLALDYPRLEIIVLDDRSQDSTADILHRMAEQEARLRVITITELPAGWLGKNYALHVGAEQAEGEFLLFTDADVRMSPDTVSRAVARMQENSLDHLCLTF
jgi:cellulose synthase/poly-beta-1,6-N-acetylglucosamine synthase-like glycosyltransferase